MDINELSKRVTKIEYHIRQLLNGDELARFFIELDLNENHVQELFKIFDAVENKLRDGRKINWVTDFQQEIENTCKISRQNLKVIISIMYDGKRYQSVCAEYMKCNPCVEFDSIVKDALGGYY